MSIFYDPDTDTLTMVLGPELSESFGYESGDITAFVDDTDQLIKLVVAHASEFVARVLATGVKVRDVPSTPSKPEDTAWQDADSSMISAFRYIEAEEVLEVMFHSTGLYRYYGVPRSVFEGLRDAPSKGSYMLACVIDVYPYEKKRGRSRR